MSDKLALHRVCLELIYPVWQNIEWDKVSPSRRMKIYDELSGKIKSSANTSTVEKFLENLCRKFEVRSLREARILQIIQDFDSRELLKTLREDTQIIILLLREKVEEKKEERANKLPEKIEKGELFV